MQLTFLGTGSAMPTGRRMQTGLLIQDGERRLLVDVGSGVIHRLADTDVGYEGVDMVLLTHHHLDHVSDLMVLIKARWLAGEESMTIVGPSGTRDLVTGLFDVHEYMQDRLAITVRDIEPGSVEVAGFDVEAMETRHSMRCLAYRFEDRLAFSGDSEAFEDLIDFAEPADYLVHDCSFPDEVDVDNHPTPSTLGAVLDGRDFERVYLTHLYPHTDGKHREMLDSIAESYDGEVQFARDGLTVSM
ncbi:MAG: MBL fold metallo-hydrolase [Halodesulfurarchaeum sp.]